MHTKATIASATKDIPLNKLKPSLSSGLQP